MTTLLLQLMTRKLNKLKNLLSNNREKGMYSNKAPFCLWLSFPFSSPPSLLLVLLNPIKKKEGNGLLPATHPYYYRLLTLLPDFSYLAFFPVLPSILPSQKGEALSLCKGR